MKTIIPLAMAGLMNGAALAGQPPSTVPAADTLFDYSVEEEVVGGLKKLGLDPATIKYASAWWHEARP